MNRPHWLAGALLACAPLTSALAVELGHDFNLQIDTALVSDYRTRGISQTQGDPALQVGATLQHASGAYLGVWSSNVDFGGGLKTRQEIDYYGGWYWQADENIALDLGYIKYAYPKESQFNQSDTYAILHAYGIEVGAYYGNDYPTYFARTRPTSTPTWPTTPSCRRSSSCACATAATTPRTRSIFPATAVPATPTTSGKPS